MLLKDNEGHDGGKTKQGIVNTFTDCRYTHYEDERDTDTHKSLQDRLDLKQTINWCGSVEVFQSENATHNEQFLIAALTVSAHISICYRWKSFSESPQNPFFRVRINIAVVDSQNENSAGKRKLIGSLFHSPAFYISHVLQAASSGTQSPSLGRRVYQRHINQ